MHVLVTGGAGYIGSHTVLELLQAGHAVTVVDNLSNASRESLSRVEQLAGSRVDFHQVDLLDRAALMTIACRARFDAVIHFAALKAVGESVTQPLRYYENNISGTLSLCDVMLKRNIRNIVFSSSATVYGDPASVPIREDFPLQATNPYGRTKLMMEQILGDVQHAEPSWNVGLLRYFNPIGAHESGMIGEDPAGVPNNLLPYVAQVAIGRLEKLSVFGNDYPTPDGTGVRDYIHVVDLAKGHLKALEVLTAQQPGMLTCNLGTGQGYSVLEVIKAFEAASGHPVPYEVVPRRAGDIAACYADPAYAHKMLGWCAERGLEAMCRDAWRWQSANPRGYRASPLVP